MIADPALPPNPYRSFWMAGFEGADHVNPHGDALDLVRANGHDAEVDADYARLAALGITSVRESVGWRLTELPAIGGRARSLELDRVKRFTDAANRHGIQIMWSLMHYGTPADVSVLDDALCARLAEFAGRIARALGPLSDTTPIYTPINEISFLAWAVAESGLMQPYGRDSAARRAAAREGRDLGFEVKCRLVRAALAAIESIRAEDPRARILHVEPLIHVATPPGESHRFAEAERIASWQWQAWDMLCGRQAPELGGHPAALDLLGVNYYHNCQWEMSTETGGGQRLEWHLRDPRRVSFAQLLRRVARRYGKPMIVAETSHVGTGRAAWLDDVAADVERARAQGVDVQGLCLYPIVDRPDWSDPTHWHHSGLWDVDASMRRTLKFDYAKTLRRWQRRLPQHPAQGSSMPHLIVFSHLRWNFVFQRPQHLLSRLAAHYHVVFIEEPIRSDGPAHFEQCTPQPNVDVLRPHTAVDAFGFHDNQLSVLAPLLTGYLDDNGITDYVVWFYTPMALPLLADLAPRAVVYDCMDELSAFKNAPRQMRQRETSLLKGAQLVLTGGPSLWEAKRHVNENALCLPSAVDAQHYAPATALQRAEPMALAQSLQGMIAGPKLGFFGVIDERLDVELVAALADADPAWQVVMVGPVVKIDPAQLPRRENLHWLGQQPYDVLPQLVAGWDVCLMPFALNESTRFISPTKTLEYMAAGKPVVSTPIHDVQAMFGDVVHIASDAPSFIDACRDALAEGGAARDERIAAMDACVWRYSWDDTAETIHQAICSVLANADEADTVNARFGFVTRDRADADSRTVGTDDALLNTRAA